MKWLSLSRTSGQNDSSFTALSNLFGLNEIKHKKSRFIDWKMQSRQLIWVFDDKENLDFCDYFSVSRFSFYIIPSKIKVPQTTDFFLAKGDQWHFVSWCEREFGVTQSDVSLLLYHSALRYIWLLVQAVRMPPDTRPALTHGLH